MVVTALVAFYEVLGLDFCGGYSICSIYGALGLDACGV